MGAVRRGIDTAQLALQVAESRVPLFRLYVLATLAQLLLCNGNLEAAESAISQGKQDPNWDAVPIFCMPVLLADGKLLMGVGHSPAAGSVDYDPIQFGESNGR